ncbi:MAG TPA: type II methionyl aminopeptidase [Thermoplasmata archaeon]|jgi:methionyl aminopeptidase|nr:MAG TPA: type II methionyl aminopeptidase [Thermoplasmata archaeon]
MDDMIYENYKRAGKIAADARNYGVTLLKPGARFLDVATLVEKKITENDAGLAFPVNIACNTLAAHYSPRHDDPLTFKKGDVVKLDVGAHVEGYIADTAITVELETHLYDTMIQASSEALENAITVINPKIPLCDVGKTIEKTITSYGYKPIENLMGHGLGRYELHSGLSVPNVGALGGKMQPKDGDVVAIEPFATNGAGHVISGAGSNIYLCKDSIKAKFIRDNKTKTMFDKINKHFGTLPFAQRWFYGLFPKDDIAIKKLSFLGVMKHYPQLVEAKGGMVTQKEHTVIVREDGCEVIT